MQTEETPDETPDHTDRLITGRLVTDITSYSKATRLRKMARGEFPLPVIQTANDCRWSYREICEWLEEQKRKRAERMKLEAAAQQKAKADREAREAEKRQNEINPTKGTKNDVQQRVAAD